MSPSPSSNAVAISEKAREEMEEKLQVQGALANEVGLVILTLLDHFSGYFRVRDTPTHTMTHPHIWAPLPN